MPRPLPIRSASASPWRHVAVALGVLLAMSLLLRFATSISDKDLTWDEVFMQPIVETIVLDGWTIGNAIDYEDTKGPVFFWLYAAWGEIAGPGIDALRAWSIAMFVLAGIPLAWMTLRCGCTVSETGVISGLYALLPYNAVLAQLLMSEPSFLLGCLLLTLIFLWGFGVEKQAERRIIGPLLFGLMLALLLHHRPHAVAYAGAAVLVATQRDGWRSWPWWTAAAAAGLARLPLYLRWGGMVTPEYQQRMGLGIAPYSLTYVTIALLPATVVLLWPVLTQPRLRHRRWWLLAGASVGLLLGIFAVPDLAGSDAGKMRYMGIIASAMRPISDGIGYRFAAALLASTGGAALGALTALTIDLRSPRETDGIVQRLAGLVLLIGWFAHIAARGAVYDRYVVPFIALLPFVLIRHVPRWLLGLQAVVLLGILWKLSRSWLV